MTQKATYEDFNVLLARSWVRYCLATEATPEVRWRYGQFYFNLLHEMKPEIANAIRSTYFDPFHKDEIPSETSEKVRELWK